MRRALLAISSALILLGLAGCGQTYELQSITVSPSSPNIEGIGSTQALTVTAHYSNTKTADVTVNSKFELMASPDPQAPQYNSQNNPVIMVDKSGIVTVLGPACTWTATLESDGQTYSYGTQPYTVVVTYGGFTAQSFVSVDSESGCYDGQTYKAPTPTTTP